MCNLYRVTTNVEAMRRLFRVTVGGFANLPAFDEIYPGRNAPVIRDTPKRERELTIMRWGLLPPSPSMRPVTNVRNLTSPFWRTALSRPDRRCLIPVTAFCEWEGSTGAKRKVWFALDHGETFAFAGVWEPGEGGERMAFLTCEPNPTVDAVHPESMPVVLDPFDYDRWLGTDYVGACALAQPFPDWRMTVEREASIG